MIFTMIGGGAHRLLSTARSALREVHCFWNMEADGRAANRVSRSPSKLWFCQ